MRFAFGIAHPILLAFLQKDGSMSAQDLASANRELAEELNYEMVESEDGDREWRVQTIGPNHYYLARFYGDRAKDRASQYLSWVMG